LEPTKELLDKVIFIADAKAQLPISERAHLNDWGVYCRVNRLPGGALFYQAGGKFIARLRFAVEEDGSITVRKYQPGEWECSLEPTYDGARFITEDFRVHKEIDELLADAKDTDDKIWRLEQRASEALGQGNYCLTNKILAVLYYNAGRFKDAEKAAIRAVEAWPSQPFLYTLLIRIYFVAVLNAKRVKVGVDNEWFIREYGTRATELTLEALGYTYEQVHTLAERYAREALKLAPQKDREFRKIVERNLSDLKMIDSTPGLKEFEEAE